jgi:tRNA 5-methylaminomethyl-2-thiouridine biosynthesis bifunctional protein
MVKVAIIGGGLAGAACAHVLKKAGAAPVIYEADALACGASGNDLGMYNPRFTAERTPQSEYYSSAYSRANTIFRHFDGIDWEPCGALHLMTDEKKEKRFPQTLKNWGWDLDHMRLVDADEASQIAGIELRYDALYLPGGGYVSPRKLCEAYARGIEVHSGQAIQSLSDLDADVIILATGAALPRFEETKDLPVKAVRGQITEINATRASQKLKCNIHYSGYISKPIKNAKGRGIHSLGATFQPWLDHTKILLEDNKDNIAKLGEFIPPLAGNHEVVGHRAAVRASSRDHFPLVGSVPEQDNLYVSAAHGSHGIVSTIMAAELLADMILDRPRCLPVDTIKALCPSRFL